MHFNEYVAHQLNTHDDIITNDMVQDAHQSFVQTLNQTVANKTMKKYIR